MHMERMEHEFLNEIGFRYIHTPVPGRVAMASTVSEEKRTLVHCCCEKGSLMSRPYVKTPMNFVDITKEDDFTTEEGYQKAISSIKGPEDTFFYCSPCTGGSLWQRLNEKRARLKGRQDTLLKIEAHRKLHWALWANFERAVLHCKRVGARVILEWPRGCSYWREPRVRTFLETNGFRYSNFDGCMYGLTTRFAQVKMPIRKPWKVACLNTCLPEMLNLTCDGSHDHSPCEGKETLYTQGYTPAICDTIHHAIGEDISRLRNRPAALGAQVLSCSDWNRPDEPKAQVLNCSDSNRPGEPKARVLSGFDCNSGGRNVSTPREQNGFGGSFVFIDVDMFHCSRFTSQGVDTPTPSQPALCCPVAMSAAPLSSAGKKGGRQTRVARGSCGGKSRRCRTEGNVRRTG